MMNIDKKNGGIARVLSRPVECVFNTLPQAIFRRASIFDDESRHFVLQIFAKIKRLGYKIGKLYDSNKFADMGGKRDVIIFRR